MAVLDESCLCQNTPHEDLKFAYALNAKATISNFDCTKADIENLESERDFFSEKTFWNLDALKSLIEEYVPANKLAEAEGMLAAVAGNQSGLSAKSLSKLWMISENQAQGAINFNTQLCKQPAENLLSRNFSTNDRMLRYRRINSVFFTGALVATSCKSTRGNKYAQIFVSDKGYIAIYPMKS